MESDRTYADITLVDMLGHELGIMDRRRPTEKGRETSLPITSGQMIM